MILQVSRRKLGPKSSKRKERARYPQKPKTDKEA